MTAMGPPHSEESSNRRDLLVWLALAACSALLIALRLHSFDLPLETDEANYAYIGARLLAGDRLYVDVWDHQPYGVYLLFAAVIAVFGDTPEVFRWMAAAFSVASLLLIAAIVRRIAGAPAAILAAALFALVSSDPGTGGEGVNREIYMNAFILAGWFCALRPAPQLRNESPPGAISWVWLVTAGLALAIGSTIKTVVAVHWLALAVWLAWAIYRQTRRPRNALLGMVAVGLAPFLIWAGSFGYFALTGRYHEFIDAVFLFNLSYSEGAGLFHRFAAFFSPPRHPFVFESAWPLWLSSALAMAWLAWRVVWYRSREASLVLVLIVAGYVAVCMPAHFWPHYYYLLIPPAVVATSVLIGDLARKMLEHNRSIVGKAEAAIVFLMLPMGVVASEYDAYLSQPPFGITVKRYNSRDFWGRAQGENVRRVTNPDDSIFVYGNEAEIYYYSGRRCASRYTMITGLAEGMDGAYQRRQILLSELQTRPPRLILLLFDQPPFDEWKQFLAEHYSGQPVGADLHDRTGEAIMLVLSRKDAPIEPINWDWDRSEVGGWHLSDRAALPSNP